MQFLISSFYIHLILQEHRAQIAEGIQDTCNEGWEEEQQVNRKKKRAGGSLFLSLQPEIYVQDKHLR